MLSKDQVSEIIETELNGALGSEWGELEACREEALQYFQGEATGDLAAPAIPNRSSVVSTDVEEVIEWIMPVLLKTFTQADEAVKFEPYDLADEPQAEQATDYTNYVFYKDNPGFLVLYQWFKDALLLKNGYVKTYYDETTKVTTEEYSGLTDMEFQLLVMDPEVEVLEHTAELLEGQGAMAMPMVAHDLKLKRTHTDGKVTVDNCPPENILVNNDHRSPMLANARFVAHEEIKTASELRGMGVSQKKIDQMPRYDQDWDEISRDSVSDENTSVDSKDPSQEKYRVYDCYILMDYDEDGISERRRVLYVRKGHILINEEFDNVPIPALTPIINPHRHIGRSIFDRIKEIAKQKTYVWRSLMDNLYFQTNARTAVNANKVNIADMLVDQPGGVIRVNGEPGPNLMPVVTPQASSSAYQMIEFLDKLRDGRTGIGPEMMGQNISLSNDTAHGIERLMSAKEELIGLIARLFAETGVKDLMLQIHALSIKHPNRKRVVQLRGEYVQVDPSEWRERTSMTATVGLGTGDELKKQQAMNQITQEQLTIIQSGGLIANQENAYRALIDKYKLAGIDARSYFTDPKTVTPPQPKPDPQVVQIEAFREVEMAKLQVKNRELDIKKAETLVDIQNGRDKQQLEAQKVANDKQAEGLKISADIQAKADELALKEAELEVKAQELALKEREIELKYTTEVQTPEAEVEISD